MEERENQEQVETVLTENETQKVEDIVETASVQEENAVSTSKKGVKKVKKEKPQESYEGLSDDEIYTKMQTEKLVQRKKKRKYFPIERRGRPNIRISHVSIRALHAAITNNIIIKNSLKQYRRIR